MIRFSSMKKGSPLFKKIQFKFLFLLVPARRKGNVQALRSVSTALRQSVRHGVRRFSSWINPSLKPIGYLRYLMIAWLFGASASMDAFNMSIGLIAFLVGSMASSLESAVLPTLVSAVQRDPESGRDLMGCINQLIIAFGCLVCLAIAFFGRDIVTFSPPGSRASA